MARAYVTIGSKFRPYSFEEQVAPLMMLEQEHQRLEDMYNSYYDNSGVVGSQLDSTLDKDILDKMYNPYMKALNDAASSLAISGITPGSRSTLSYLRRRYNNEIVPIQAAVQARQLARENWTKMSAQDRTLMTNANPYMKGVSEYMNGRSPETTYVSGNELYSRGQALSKAMSNVLRNIPSEEALALQDQYWRIAQQKGFDSDEMLGFLNGIADAVPELSRQVEQIMQSSGIYNKGFTESDVNRARQYIIEGMASGMSGDTKIQYLQNKQWELDHTPRTGSETAELPVKLPTYTIGMGQTSDGAPYKDLEEFSRTLTLRNGSVSNIELDRLISQYGDSLKTISDIESKYGRYTVMDNVPVGSLGTSGATAIAKGATGTTSRTEGFQKEDGTFVPISSLKSGEREAFDKARRTVYGIAPSDNTPDKQMKKIQDRINMLTDKYSHIPGKDAVDSIQKGIALDIAQASRERTGIVPRVTPTEQKNAVASILNGIGLSAGTEKSKSRGLMDIESGKMISNRELDNLIHDNNSTEGRFQVVSTDDEPIVVYDNETGKSYAPYGTMYEIDSYRRRYHSLNNFLKDYSNSESGIGNKDAEISELNLSILRNYGIMPAGGGRDLGDGYKGFITYSEDNDIVKIIVKRDPYTGFGKIVGMSTLNDELGYGEYRGNFIKDASSGFLHDIFIQNQAK